jgi:hypothetical protein
MKITEEASIISFDTTIRCEVRAKDDLELWQGADTDVLLVERSIFPQECPSLGEVYE